MYKTKRMNPSADAMSTMIQIEQIPENGVYETAESTTSRMDDPYEHVMEYISYWFSMSVVFTLKDILGRSILVSGDSE